MELLRARVRPTYFKYFAAAFGSSLISCIYGMVDTAAVGRAVGPNGTAALSIVLPVWTIIYSLGLMMGIGGSVLFSTQAGMGRQEEANRYFTVSLIGALAVSVVCWVVLALFDRPILLLFGADEALLPLAREYLWPIKFVIPTYLLTQTLSAFLRNDGNPVLATVATLSGGVFNVFGDIFLSRIVAMSFCEPRSW